MSLRPHLIGGIALLLFIGLSPGSVLAAAQETPPQPPVTQETPPPPPVDATAPAAEEAPAVMSCGDCHELAAGFGANPHARGKVEDKQVPNKVCESCHGNGAAHMEAGGDTSLIFKPVGLEGSDKACLSCHDVSNNRRSAHAGFHANTPAVNCLSCHSIHHSDARTARLLVKPEVPLCAGCHATQAASFRNKPYAHRIGRGGMGCSSCHEPHGRPTPNGNLRRTAADEKPCMSCHSDKRGPHVFPHGSVAIGECTNCHEPHGSTNPKMLTRSSVMQLCLECHSAITHDTLGSQPPSFHNINNPRYQNCTSCHVAVHGSNRNPQLLK